MHTCNMIYDILYEHTVDCSGVLQADSTCTPESGARIQIYICDGMSVEDIGNRAYQHGAP